MKRLEYKPFKGLQIVCNKCKRTIHKEVLPDTKCSHPIESQRYKVVMKIPNTGGERKSLNLNVRTYNEAVVECIKFEKELANPTIKGLKREQKPIYFMECVAMYGDYLENVGIPHHLRKQRTQKHIQLTLEHIALFLRFLAAEGYKLEGLKVSDITEKEVGMYCAHVEGINQSNHTFNAKIKCLSAFYNYLIKEKKYPIVNEWARVRKKSIRSTDISVTKKDFDDLLEAVSPLKSTVQVGKTKKNMFRYWLKDIFQLKAFTGVRHEELLSMRWDMIYFEEGTPLYVKSPNVKVNKQQNNFKEQEFEYNYIPIGEELSTLLYRFGLEQYKNTKNYIIAPEELRTPKMQKFIGTSFTFYFKRLNRGYTRQSKHLRQTFITAINQYANRISLTHSSFRITEKHYIDRSAVAIQLAKSGFRIFAKDTLSSLQQDTPSIKKGTQFPESLDNQGGRYWVRTSDPLLVRQSTLCFAGSRKNIKRLTMALNAYFNFQFSLRISLSLTFV